MAITLSNDYIEKILKSDPIFNVHEKILNRYYGDSLKSLYINELKSSLRTTFDIFYLTWMTTVDPEFKGKKSWLKWIDTIGADIGLNYTGGLKRRAKKTIKDLENGIISDSSSPLLIF